MEPEEVYVITSYWTNYSLEARESLKEVFCDLWLDCRCALGRCIFGLGAGQLNVVHPKIKGRPKGKCKGKVMHQ